MEPPAAGADPLRSVFGERLYDAARQLITDGHVLEVRVLQGGAIMTGTVSVIGTGGPSRHRIYIRRAAGGPKANPQADTQASPQASPLAALPKFDSECSCNSRTPCVHVAAIAIAAQTQQTPPSQLPPRPATSAIPTHAATSAQRLFYTLAPAQPLCLTVAVGSTLGASQPLSLRAMSGGDFPRYVDPSDQDILKALAPLKTDGPWELNDTLASALLPPILATGRAYWRDAPNPLQSAPPRRLDFAWELMPDGNQQLRCQSSVHVLLSTEPPVYIDPAAAHCGAVESPHPLSWLRHYCALPPQPPEQAPQIRQQIQQQLKHQSTHQNQPSPDPPQPRMFEPRPHPLTQPRGRVRLTGGPAAHVDFVYDGIAVDADRLRAEAPVVRQSHEGVIHDLPRDLPAEQTLRAQLTAQRLPSPGEGRERWLGFMLNGVPALRAAGWDIQVAADFPYALVYADHWYGDLDTQRQGWFNLRLGVLVNGQPVNLLPALVHYLRVTLGGGQIPLHNATSDATPSATGPDPASLPDDAACRVGEHWIIRLDDGRHLPVAIERIQRIADTLVELFDSNDSKNHQALTLPLSHASRVAQLARELARDPAHELTPWTQDPTADEEQARAGEAKPAPLYTDDPALRALLNDLQNPDRLQPPTLPPDFQAMLRPYQSHGVAWMQFLRRHQLGGILADDMGLGKTVQTIAHLACEKAAGRLLKPALIVAPVSTLGNWFNELRRFAPQLAGLLLHGQRRRESFGRIDKVDVVITGYALLQLDSDTLLGREYSLVVFDEAQTLKNPRAKVAMAARALRAEQRLALSGTPVENHLGDLWSLFECVNPGLLGDERSFQRHYRTPIEKENNLERAQALSRRLAPFLLRRTKDAVAADLPPKTQIVETLVLEEQQRDFYDGIRLATHRQIQEVVRQQGLARSQLTILDALLKLRQVCCDPRLLGATEEHARIPNAKLDWLCSALPELIAEGRRVLLFSQFTSMLSLIEATVTRLGIPYCLLTGRTQDRASVIDRFQSGAVPLFLISLKAGGTGLNLTTADTVIHYDPWWNPAAESQATDRAHRIGQTKPVFVYKLIAQDTVEERILQLQANKHALARQLFEPGAAAPASLTSDDIEALFAP